MSSPAALAVPLQFAGQSRAEIFQSIFTVFLALGTLVGVVVIGYTLYNAYRNRDDGAAVDAADGAAAKKQPRIGELPSGGGGGRKLFLSFAISAIIVVGLIIWTYSALLYVEGQPNTADAEQINVTGEDFTWQFEYDNGVTTVNELRVPANERVVLRATSGDVWHTFGIPEKHVKTDAIPGQTSTTWFDTGETGEYRAECFELCGTGHSGMTADVIVMEPEAYEQWLANQSDSSEAAANESDGANASANRLDAGDAAASGPTPNDVAASRPAPSAAAASGASPPIAARDRGESR
ncbi:cytochrome c oxidase subunit II [Natronoarchaeum mannanilyticum]|uniref:Cytochrome oxidase subunit II copper A binding domain-containing protein n=1 Tax=Natronoarchaeum mannanilyticum TaxID=926360 RepID=A0AAV3T7Z5_9EURY